VEAPLKTVAYKLADGKRITLNVAFEVAELLAQSDSDIRLQRQQDERYLIYTGCIDEMEEAAMAVPQEDIADLLVRMDSHNQLHAALEKLPNALHRRVFMHYFLDMDYLMIACEEGVGVKIVARSVELAILFLRESLDT